MKNSDFTIVLDNGHGVNTPGKRSPVWSDQPQLLEWEWTRDLVQYIIPKLTDLGFAHRILVPELRDICLTTRCERANRLMTTRPHSILISIHGNAAGVEAAKGFEIFSSPGITESDKVAEAILDRAAETGLFKMRYDPTHPYKNKEEKFKILTGTTGNAILIEAGFYTNHDECDFMMSIEGKNLIASIIAEGLNNYVKTL